MRTRRIAIGCRRAERTATAAIGPAEFTTHPELEPPDPSVPAYLANGGPAHPRRPDADPRNEVDWNQNPGWPGEGGGWTRIARSAAGRPYRTPQPPLSPAFAPWLSSAPAGPGVLARPLPRHARISRHPALGFRLNIPERAFTWTGRGLGAAIALALIANAVSEIVR
jgi:hypothetical protein